MKKLILASAIYLFTAASFAASCDSMVYDGNFPVTKAKTTILCKNGFVIGYSLEKKTLLWVAEKLVPGTSFNIDHRPSFHKDSSIAFNAQSSNTDFVGSGYDKGHMVPFEDMSYSAQSADDSMLLTNIVPQNFANNRGGWKSLEMQARKLSLKEPIYVVSGPIFEGKVDYLNGRVPIPSKLFKVIIVGKTSKTYILPNTPVSAAETRRYISTRSALKLLGVDTNPNANLKDLK